MKAIVIGLGSMGRRRCRLLASYDKHMAVVGIDNREDRRCQAENELGIRTYVSIDEAVKCLGGADVAFVATSPLSHAKIIHQSLKMGMHTFTEINLTDDMYDENMMLAKDKGLVLFLSSTPMYRREIEYIKDAVAASEHIKSYIYHVGQYLPDWHPWEDYKNFFVGDKRTNGCREIMAIEFPWIFDVFGKPIKWSAQCIRSTSLEIDFPDTFQIMMEHFTGNKGIIQFDVASRNAVRNFECMAEDLYISWDGTPNGLKRFDAAEKKSVSINLYDKIDKRSDYGATIIEDAYLAEIEEFMNAILGKAMPRHTFDRDRQMLNIVREIGA